MKIIQIILITIFIASCSAKKEDPELIRFNKCLGSKQAKALDKLVQFVDHFIELNFSVNQDNIHQGYYMFLDTIIEDGLENSNYIFDKNSYQKIHLLVEKSGLYSEIYTSEAFDDPEAEIIFPDYTNQEENKNQINFNYNGQYIKCLINLDSKDSIVINYIDAKQLVGFVSPNLMAAGLLYESKEVDFKNEIIKRIIAIEFFL